MGTDDGGALVQQCSILTENSTVAMVTSQTTWLRELVSWRCAYERVLLLKLLCLFQIDRE